MDSRPILVRVATEMAFCCCSGAFSFQPWSGKPRQVVSFCQSCSRVLEDVKISSPAHNTFRIKLNLCAVTDGVQTVQTPGFTSAFPGARFFWSAFQLFVRAVAG